MAGLIEIRELSVAFSGRPVLDRVTATCRRGEITVVVGPSGSGKTTLLRAINRLNELYPGAVTRGSVRIAAAAGEIEVYGAGTDVTRLRRLAAMVFQSPAVLPVSIERNFTLPLRLTLGLATGEIRARMERSLAEAELLDEVKDRLREPARSLSGGQQQRLCLARALCLEPEVLLLDEPTASLDFKSAQRIEELLLRLKDRYTIVAVSHSLGQASRIADRCLVLRGGSIIDELDRSLLLDPARLRTMLEEAF